MKPLGNTYTPRVTARLWKQKVQQDSAWGNKTLSVVTRNTVLTLQGLIIRKYPREINAAANARQCMDKLRGQLQTGEGLTTDSYTTTVVDCKQATAKLDCRVHDINDDELFLTQRDRPKRKVAM